MSSLYSQLSWRRLLEVTPEKKYETMNHSAGKSCSHFSGWLLKCTVCLFAVALLTTQPVLISMHVWVWKLKRGFKTEFDFKTIGGETRSLIMCKGRFMVYTKPYAIAYPCSIRCCEHLYMEMCNKWTQKPPAVGVSVATIYSYLWGSASHATGACTGWHNDTGRTV